MIIVCAFVPSTAVTVAVTVCRAVTGFGALYVIVVSPVESGPDAAPITAPATAGLKSHVTEAGETPVTRAESVHVPPPPSAQPLTPPAVAPSDTSVSARSPAAPPSSRTHETKVSNRYRRTISSYLNMLQTLGGVPSCYKMVA